MREVSCRRLVADFSFGMEQKKRASLSFVIVVLILRSQNPPDWPAVVPRPLFKTSHPNGSGTEG